jgi:5-deoxy-glucuronate isomerase
MHRKTQLKKGLNRIVQDSGKEFDPSNPNAMMDFSVLCLDKGESFTTEVSLERALIILTGSAKMVWDNKEKETDEAQLKEQVISRKSIFDDSPWVFSIPRSSSCEIHSLEDSTEFAIVETTNERYFKPRVFTPEQCKSEDRGAGTMRETSTRIVRTAYDYTNHPEANLVVGEVINYPGKWSSYPPHHHPQPEIYYYRFLPEQGFGFAMVNDGAAIVKNNDSTLIIHDDVHSQSAAPGYAMWYLWIIRHLDGNPYGKVVFLDEHKWVMDKDAKIWPYEK